MRPLPIFDNPKYKSAGKLKGKVAIITGEILELAEVLPLHMCEKVQKLLLFI